MEPYLIRVCETQRVLTNAIEDPRLIEAAKNVTYYVAMLSAAETDPLDDPMEQAEACEYFESKAREHLAVYMDLVNNGL